MNRDYFFVTPDSDNLIKELQGYVWDTDRQGNPTGKPIKKNDHAIDAVVYFIGTHGKYDGSYR